MKTVKTKTVIVVANTTDEAKVLVPWATMFQRTECWKTSNKWKCSTFIYHENNSL